MNFLQMLDLGTKLQPYANDIKELAELAQEIEADPKAKDAILTAEKYFNDPRLAKAAKTIEAVATIFQQSGAAT